MRLQTRSPGVSANVLSFLERLTREGMLMREAPYPWRKEELRALARMFGLPE